MDIDRIVAELKSERNRLEQAIAALGGTSRTTASGGQRRRRHMSAAARARISKAMKARWASGKMKGNRKKAA
jgi:hypothetical protein